MKGRVAPWLGAFSALLLFGDGQGDWVVVVEVQGEGGGFAGIPVGFGGSGEVEEDHAFEGLGGGYFGVAGKGFAG